MAMKETFQGPCDSSLAEPMLTDDTDGDSHERENLSPRST